MPIQIDDPRFFTERPPERHETRIERLMRLRGFRKIGQKAPVYDPRSLDELSNPT